MLQRLQTRCRFRGRQACRFLAVLAWSTWMTCSSASAAGPTASELFGETGVTGGLIVHLGCDDGSLCADLARKPGVLVHGLDADAADVARAQKQLRDKGVYGKASVEQFNGDRLPYADNLVNLIIVDDASRVATNEIMRVLAPKGVAYVNRGGSWTKTVKPWPDEIDDWTHYLHDASGNAVADDSRVGPPNRMQWVCKPMYARSHEIDATIDAMVSAQGRVVYIFDEGLPGITDERLPETWSLVCRDAFSGVELWKRPLPNWGWPQWKKSQLAGKDWTGLRGQRTRSPLTIPRRLVAVGDHVFITLGYQAPVSVLDAKTGKTLRTIAETAGADELVFCDGLLIARKRLGLLEIDGDDKDPPEGEVLMAIDPDSGNVVWKQPYRRAVPLTLAACKGRVFYHDYANIVCRDLKSGKQLWATPRKPARAGLWGSGHTMVALDDVVLFLGPKRLTALSTETGKKLWEGRGGRGPGVSNPPDLFVADGLVWYGGSEAKNGRKSIRALKSGHDPKTGKVERKVDAPKLITPGHHYRCYRSKATKNYLLWPKRGIEFLDIQGDDHMRHDWLRASCKLGVMPANGLLYVTPHQCFCYPGVKLAGLNALASDKQKVTVDDGTKRLVSGPAYDAVQELSGTCDAGDWPTFRNDATRSGSTAVEVTTSPKRLWQTELGGKLTQPVVVGDLAFVASVDAHAVICLNAEDGKQRWLHTAGGRVDSPPTYYQGLVLFGSADGMVTCLRASDGRLVWRFRAAPRERRIVAFGRLESAWPVHGTVLVKDGVAYCAAGRSSYLDGGIFLSALDPKTGKLLHQARVEGPYPDVTKDIGRPFDMDGTQSDVLVTDGEYLYMQQAVFDAQLRPCEAPRITNMGDRKMGRHLFSTAGLLDDTWWNRTYWSYSERWPGYYIGHQAPKAGQLLVFDDKRTYGVKCYTERNRHSPMFFPGTKGYLLFADDNDVEPTLVDKDGKPQAVRWLPKINPKTGWSITTPAVDRDKGPGFTRTKEPTWSTWLPVRIRAMVLAGDTLFAAGPPDVLDKDDPLAAFEGRKGAKLCAFSAATGKKLAEQSLASPPVFDGMIAADGRLFIATCDGRIVCMGKAS